MKPTPQFLEVEHVVALHARAIAEHGGSLGLRDPAMLASAVAMPKATFGGAFLHPGLAAMAAAYLFHLCKNHPFIDGNKRVALVAAEMFVRYNDQELAATNSQLEAITLGVADGSISKEALTDFFREFLRPRKSPPQRHGKQPKRRKR